jgi:hypothetical protein
VPAEGSLVVLVGGPAGGSMTSPYAGDRAADIGAAPAPAELASAQSDPDPDPDPDPECASAGSAAPGAQPAPGARGPLDGGSVLPEQSPEDTDAAWGEYPESRDDHFYRDRPPHWDNY